MKRLALVCATILAVSVGGAGASASSSLELHGVLQGHFDNVSCPAGTAPTTSCYLNEAKAAVRGLGNISITYTLFIENADTDCATWRMNSSFTSGKGQIAIAAQSGCTPYGPNGVMSFSITGGTGAYSGASGSGRLDTKGTGSTAGRGSARTALSGTLDVPGRQFDLNAPKLAGVKNRIVKAGGKANRVRVRFKVTAEDEEDGSTRVACEPRSGSRFRVGRTRVACSATDTSANTARARFWVIVRRASRK